MLRNRVIPCLLLSNGGLVKTVRFSEPKYVGDPINAVRIFNEKEVDELIILDINSSRLKSTPNYEQIKDIVSEAFMPLAYGGGICTVLQARNLIEIGVEKVVINTAAISNFELVQEIAKLLGSQCVVVAVDVKKDWLGRYRVFRASDNKLTSIDPVDHVKAAVKAGAGEIFINDVMRDGTGIGYDLDLLAKISQVLEVPFIACGGANSLDHFKQAISVGVSAVAAGSMFVFVGKHRAVMINYPSYKTLQGLF